MAVKKSELYSLLWDACNKLRGGVEPSRYKDYVLVLLFFKYVSDRYKGQRFAEFTVNEGASFDDLIAAKGKSDVGERVDKIIQKFLEENRLQGSLPDVSFNNPDELGSGKELVDKVSGLIAIFQNPAIDFKSNRASGDDIIGDAYEYFMMKFAQESGKSKGQFYTPNDMQQLNSLTAQISGLTRLVATVDTWRLVDVYIDIASSKSKSLRKDFARMVEDSKQKKINIVITNSLSRFGRDTVDTLEALKILGESDIRVIFEQENLDSAETDNQLMISIVEALAQAENESRSENIKWGIKKKVEYGTSKLADRKCYGYDSDENGKLIVNEEQATIVQKIFNLYLGGKSVTGILKELENLGIKSPTGKDKWNKRTVELTLTKRKYIGEAELLKSDENSTYYLISDNNPAIISKEVFEAVQKRKTQRSNVTVDEEGTKHRSANKYSSKKK
jgi:site-specific DNA recombinase